MGPEPRLVVVGASAGGIRPLQMVLAALPASFQAAVLVVVHIPPSSVSRLPRILGRSTPLTVVPASSGERLQPAATLVAPPDRHLLVGPRHAVLSKGPTVNGARPSVDVLFASAAEQFGPRVIAVVLSGALRDGARGMAAVVSRGGVGVVQDPAEAMHTGMPTAAMTEAHPQYVLPAEQIATLLRALVVPDDDSWTEQGRQVEESANV